MSVPLTGTLQSTCCQQAVITDRYWTVGRNNRYGCRIYIVARRIDSRTPLQRMTRRRDYLNGRARAGATHPVLRFDEQTVGAVDCAILRPSFRGPSTEKCAAPQPAAAITAPELEIGCNSVTHAGRSVAAAAIVGRGNRGPRSRRRKNESPSIRGPKSDGHVADGHFVKRRIATR